MNHIISDKRIEHIGVGLGVIAFTALAISTLFPTQKKGVPTIPYSFPFIGSTLDYYTDPLKFIKANTEMFGSVFNMHMHGHLSAIVGAEDAPEVFNNPELSFLKSQSRFFSNSLFHDGASKFTLPHNAVQSSVMKHLTPNLKDYSPRSFERFLKESDHLLGDLKEPLIVPNLLPFMRSFVARYSACAFVGEKLSNDQDLIHAFENSVSDIGKEFRPGVFRVIFPTLNEIYMRFFYPRAVAIKKYRTLIKNALQKELLDREAQKSNPGYIKNTDILEYLLDEYPHAIDNDHLETLTSVILIFIFVGVHTTTDAITYVMYCLVKHPEYIAELLQEQKEEAVEGIYTTDMYRRMVKLDSFIREALRIRVIGIGLAHTNISGHDIKLKSGATVKSEQEVFINMWHIHHDEKNQSYMSNLDKFDGFRFVNKDRLVTKTGHDFVAFGMGKHACPGRWFAIHQIKGIVSHFLQHYKMTALEEIKLSGQDNYTGSPTGSVQFQKI